MITLYGANGTHSTLSGRFAVVEYHLWDTYEEPWGAARGQTFYNVIFQGTPCNVYDGLYDAWPIETYHNKFLTRVAVPTPVTMEVFAEETAPNRYTVTTTTCLEEQAAPTDLRLYMMMIEDRYPSSPSYSRNTFRTAATNIDITLLPGECSENMNSVIVAPATLQTNLKVIAWAQDPNNAWPASVHQAAIKAWPFGPPSVPGDLNGDGVVDATDLAMLLGDWGPVGNCDPIPADVNGDCAVDATDLAILLGDWG